MLIRLGLLAIAICLLLPGTSSAGMPSALPSDLPMILRLNAEPHQRLQAISFFLLGLLVSTLVVKVLWNTLARDFSWLSRLTFWNALAVVILWGLLFVIVLTMISGARELMTPGAWKKVGLTHKLQDTPAPAAPPTAKAD